MAKNPKHHKVRLDAAEFDCVLAALRCYQNALTQGLAALKDFEDIATNWDEHEPLDVDEIDELCERLNTEP